VRKDQLPKDCITASSTKTHTGITFHKRFHVSPLNLHGMRFLASPTRVKNRSWMIFWYELSFDRRIFIVYETFKKTAPSTASLQPSDDCLLPSSKPDDFSDVASTTTSKNQESRLIFPWFFPLIPSLDRRSNRFSSLLRGMPARDVEITHIVNASLFYVRELAAKPIFARFEKDLMEHERNRRYLTRPIKSKQGAWD